MSNLNSEELGRIVADALVRYMQPPGSQGQRQSQRNSASDVNTRDNTRQLVNQVENSEHERSEDATSAGTSISSTPSEENFESRCVGRPKKNVDVARLREMVALRYNTSQIAGLMGISRPTVYKIMKDNNINAAERYSSISDSELDNQLVRIKETHPNVGEVMAAGHLHAQGIHVRRASLRSSLHRVDPDGVVERRRSRLRHRVYDNPCPNYVWHIDGNHKLVRWGFVIHVAIDGFSRLVTFAEASTNNLSATVLNHFLQAVDTFGRPLRVRTDHGGENSRVWQDMVASNGVQSVIVGSSIRNQRVERFNLDININVTRPLSSIFRDLEFESALDPANETDLFCLQYVYTARVNKVLHEFVAAHNHHAMSTERSATPMQLFHAYRHITELHSSLVHSDPYPTLNVQDLLVNLECLPHVEVTGKPCPISLENFHELQERVNPLATSSCNGKDLYNQTLEFVAQCLLE